MTDIALIVSGHSHADSFCARLVDADRLRHRTRQPQRGRHSRGDMPVDANAAVRIWLLTINSCISLLRHLVVTPVSWGGAPATLKALFDQVFSGFAAVRFFLVEAVDTLIVARRRRSRGQGAQRQCGLIS